MNQVQESYTQAEENFGSDLLNNNPSLGYVGPKIPSNFLPTTATSPPNLIHAIIDTNTTRKDFIAEEMICRKPKVVGIYRLIMKAGAPIISEYQAFKE